MESRPERDRATSLAFQRPWESLRQNPRSGQVLWNLKNRSRLHVERRLYHLFMGLTCFCLYALTPMSRLQALAFLLCIGGSWVLLDSLRLRIAPLNRVALSVFGRLMRREEAFGLSANTFFIFGLITVVWLFPPQVAQLSILYLAFGDPIAALVGTRYGRRRLLGKKSLEGFLANYFACLAVTWIAATQVFDYGNQHALTLALLGGISGAVAEILPIPGDDNFNIPVFSASILFIFDRIFSIFLF